MYGHARFGIENASHDEADLFGRVKLPCARDAALGKLANEIFVAPSDNIRLHVVQSQPLLADTLNQIAQTVIGEVPLPVRSGVEIDAVDDSFEQGVFARDGTHVSRKLFADLIRQLANN